VTPVAVAYLFCVFGSRLRVGARGFPTLPRETAAEIAKAVLRQNAGAVLVAGTGHFRYMWVSDFGKAFRGAKRALSPEYLRGQIASMIRESARLGKVLVSVFAAALDMPWYADACRGSSSIAEHPADGGSGLMRSTGRLSKSSSPTTSALTSATVFSTPCRGLDGLGPASLLHLQQRLRPQDAQLASELTPRPRPRRPLSR
jgi:hypothetical protein